MSTEWRVLRVVRSLQAVVRSLQAVVRSVQAVVRSLQAVVRSLQAVVPVHCAVRTTLALNATSMPQPAGT